MLDYINDNILKYDGTSPIISMMYDIQKPYQNKFYIILI